MAIQINDSINNEAVLSSCYKVLGIIEFLENDLNSAEEHFNKALKISENLGLNSQKVATIESIIKLASISKQKKDFKAQLKYLLMAAEYSKKNNLPTHLQIAYNELMMFYSLRNKQELVQKYIIAYRSISDSLNQKQLNDRYNLTNSIVQVHELYKTKNELEKMNFLQSQRIKNRNIILLIITISIIALVFLLFKLYTTNKKLKIQNLTIESQKANLEVLNNTKDKFFSIVAHDLKSPLNSLKAFSSLLIDHYDLLSKEEILNMSQQLKISVDNTIKMADNLIMWARIQMSDIQFKEEVIKVKDIASNICDVYNDVALTKGINVSCTVDDSLVITGDKNQIEFVIRNLVNNAIKFTHKDGLVRLTAKALADGQVQISVSDSGVGISDEIKSKLFSIGKKQSTNGTDGEKGTGLGLMLSHEFIKLNGGQIDIESIVGKGTTFNVKFNSGQ